MVVSILCCMVVVIISLLCCRGCHDVVVVNVGLYVRDDCTLDDMILSIYVCLFVSMGV